MKVIINTKNHIDVTEREIEQWQGDIDDALQRFGDWITRVEVHLSDENSKEKGGGDDIRCLMEARPAGHQPVSIEVRTGSVGQAVQEAIDTLERRLDNLLDKTRTEGRKRK